MSKMTATEKITETNISLVYPEDTYFMIKTPTTKTAEQLYFTPLCTKVIQGSKYKTIAR